MLQTIHKKCVNNLLVNFSVFNSRQSLSMVTQILLLPILLLRILLTLILLTWKYLFNP